MIIIDDFVLYLYWMPYTHDHTPTITQSTWSSLSLTLHSQQSAAAEGSGVCGERCLALDGASCANRQPWCQGHWGLWVRLVQTDFDVGFHGSLERGCGSWDTWWGTEASQAFPIWEQATITTSCKWVQIISRRRTRHRTQQSAIACVLLQSVVLL